MTLRMGKHCGRLLAWLGLTLASATALADNVLGLGPDTRFGTVGFVAVPNWPTIDSGTQPVAVGLAHMDVSGGYLAATLQRVSGNWRMVMSRYTEAGALDTGWGVSGSQMPGLPAAYYPGGSPRNVRLVVGQQAGLDIYYLAFNFLSGSDVYVAAAKFTASGAFDSGFGAGGFSSTLMPASLPGAHGAYVQAAAFDTVAGQPAMVIALQGNGSNKLLFSRAEAGGLTDDGTGGVLNFVSALNVTQIRANGADNLDVVGGLGADAFYVHYSATAHFSTSKVFRLKCPSGTAGAVIDAVERPPGWGEDLLVLGRADCNGIGLTATAERVTSLDGSPTEVYYRQTDTAGPCFFFNTTCDPVALIYDPARPDLLLTVTPNGAYAPMNPATLSTPSLYAESSVTPGFTVTPSTQTGLVYRHPRVVGFATAGALGIGAVLIDGIFHGNFEAQ